MCAPSLHYIKFAPLLFNELKHRDTTVIKFITVHFFTVVTINRNELLLNIDLFF